MGVVKGVWTLQLQHVAVTVIHTPQITHVDLACLHHLRATLNNLEREGNREEK